MGCQVLADTVGRIRVSRILRSPTVANHLIKSRCISSNNSTNGNGIKNSLVVGVYAGENGNIELTNVGKIVNQKTEGRLAQSLAIGQKKFKIGKSRLLFNIDKDYPAIAAVCLGKKLFKANDLENVNETKENLRQASAVGVKALRDVDARHIEIDPCSDPKAMAEGASLMKFAFENLKEAEKQQGNLNIKVHQASQSVEKKWKEGLVCGEGQNFARDLMETPSNLLTPHFFTKKVIDRFSRLQSVKITVREESWIKEMKMGAFLSVAKGSCEKPYLLEMKYFGSSNEDERPLVLVGKGITFDSGGISIKPAMGMSLMKGDMGGAAAVVGALEAIARLELPLNVITIVPLCENMPSGSANKPGDVVTAMNGKTIEIDNTDAEGRLILADALTYSQSFNPRTLIDVATLTGAIDVALGAGAAGAYTNSEQLWQHFMKAAYTSGDRVWRMPLFQLYKKQVQSDIADLLNVGKKPRAGGSCTAAAFLKEFVKSNCWAHLDIAGVMGNSDEVPYLGKGMSGRPTRTLVELASRLAKDVVYFKDQDG